MHIIYTYTEKCNIHREFLHVRFADVCSPEDVGVHMSFYKGQKIKRFKKDVKSLSKLKVMYFWIYYNQRADLLKLNFFEKGWFVISVPSLELLLGNFPL